MRRGILKIVITKEPFATVPKWYLINFPIAYHVGVVVGLPKYQKATAAANANC